MTRRLDRRHYTGAMDSLGAVWRAIPPRVLDVAIVLALLIPPVVDTNVHDLGGALVVTLPLLLRRDQPLPAFLLVMLGIVVMAALGAGGELLYVAVLALMVAAYSLGVWSSRRVLSLVVILAAAMFIVYNYGGRLPSLPDFAGPFVVMLPLWLAGNAIRNWQLRAGASEDRAERLEREQERATQAALAAERARITRELHDVVAHSVSVMVVQAGAARQVLTDSPVEAREALLAVEASGREAMGELRNLLGLLNQGGEDLALAPQPGIDQLDALIHRVSDAGLPVQVRVEGTPQPLPVGLDLAAYRIIQEALTNALKYSGLARTEVILAYREDDVKVEILDEGTGERPANGHAPGRGLVGMQERVALYGGALEAGPRLGRGYAVRAWLPIRE